MPVSLSVTSLAYSRQCFVIQPAYSLAHTNLFLTFISFPRRIVPIRSGMLDSLINTSTQSTLQTQDGSTIFPMHTFIYTVRLPFIECDFSVGQAFEVVFVYFVFPETTGRTLEELAFSKEHLLTPISLQSPKDRSSETPGQRNRVSARSSMAISPLLCSCKTSQGMSNSTQKRSTRKVEGTASEITCQIMCF